MVTSGNGFSLIGLLFVSVVLFEGFYLTGAIDCYNCTDIAHTEDCHTTAYCPNSAYCYVRSTRHGVNLTYTLGCANETMCVGTTSTVATTTVTTTTTTTNTTSSTAAVTPKTTTNNTITTSVLPTNASSLVTTTIASSLGQFTAFAVPTKCNTSLSNSSTCGNGSLLAPTHPITTTPGIAGSFVGKRYLYIPNKDNLNNDDDEEENDSMYDEPGSCDVCCATDSCNKHACDPKPIITTTTPDPDVCQDKEGVGCELLQQLLNICNNVSKAKQICKKSCDLCSLVDGNWSEWGNWSSCAVTCGNGSRTRERECDHPPPANGGDNCTGSGLDTEMCKEQDCPTDGNWADWTAWSDCSVTCDIGLQKRIRNCSNPYPDGDGLFCLGAAQDEKICIKQRCNDDQWLDWSEWSQCSRTCGVGLTNRARYCNGTSLFGLSCSGDAKETKLCTEVECLVGNWSEWSTWSECSATCDNGIKIRTRDCNETDNSCIGDAHETVICKKTDCTEPMSAFLVNGVAERGPGNDTIVFTHVITNVGNDYNSTSGQFTCRVPGIYSFTLSIEKPPDVNQAFCHLMKNDNATIYVGARSAFINSSSYQQASNSATLQLKVDDVVHLGKCSAPSTFTTKSTFTGSLIVANYK